MTFSARHWNTHEPSMDNLRRWEEMSRQGSESLRKAMRLEFGKLAHRHGITVGDARLLCMNGEGL